MNRALVALAVVALAIVALARASTAQAETIELPKTLAKLTVPDGWTPVKAAGVVAAYKTEGGSLLAITRADVPNPDAWKSDTKAAYAEKIERGLKAGIPGYRRTAKKLADVNGVPTLDLEAKRDGGAVVVARVLLFRTYALSLAIEVPKGGDIAAARAIAQAFAPPPPLPPATSKP